MSDVDHFFCVVFLLTAVSRHVFLLLTVLYTGKLATFYEPTESVVESTLHDKTIFRNELQRAIMHQAKKKNVYSRELREMYENANHEGLVLSDR